jgi:hypothetical protein
MSDVPVMIDEDAPAATPFVALIAVESDERMGDGNAGDPRVAPPGVYSWREPPATIHLMTDIAPGHDGAEAAGHVDVYKRLPSSDPGLVALFGEVPGEFAVVARGVFDTGETGSEAARMVEERTLTGVSVNPTGVLDVQESCVATAEDDFGEYCSQWEIRFLRYEIGGFAIVDVPAHEPTTIRVATAEDLQAFDQLADSGPGQGAEEDDDLTEGLGEGDEEELAASAFVASALLGGRKPPTSTYFTRPEPGQLTAFTVGEPDADGWVPCWGHVAPAEGSGVCHIGYPGECKEAPASASSYAHFNLGAFPTSDGDVAVGRITMGTGHAPLRLGRRPVSAMEAQGHYDHNGFVAAYVHASNGEHGWWVAGVVRPSLTPEQVLDLKAGSLSGDWRPIGGNVEGVAALVVNVPGFPIPRAESLVASGRFAGLVASGIVRKDSGCGCEGAATRTRLDNLEREMRRQRLLTADREYEALTASVHRHRPEDVEFATLRLRP